MGTRRNTTLPGARSFISSARARRPPLLRVSSTPRERLARVEKVVERRRDPLSVPFEATVASIARSAFC